MTAAGLAGSVLLHVLLVAPFFLDLSLPQSRTPNRNGAGASALISAAEPVMTVVFINEPTFRDRREPPELLELASRGFARFDKRLRILSPDPEPAADSPSARREAENAATPEATEDQTQHALLYGRYLGQVQARIERAWLRPRSDIGAPTFSCGVKIEQNARGDVVGIALDHCNGTERWQQSLMSAIRTASPLPAPPDPSVYADRLWLTFRSERFRAEGPTEGFDPENAAARDDRFEARRTFERFADGTDQNFGPRLRKSSDVVHLTIIGSPTGPGSLTQPVSAPSTPTTSDTAYSPPQ
jgi:hypothetical protein